ncbi:MAG: hypothetical protein K8S94_02245 [Planctomycetia bacterium]|nr:hypothetical protein [Planctomycetia bacterium]
MIECIRPIAHAAAVALLVVRALPLHPATGGEPPSPPEAQARAQAEFEERSRKVTLFASDRWRRAVFELDEWLAVQPVYTPAQVAAIRNDFAARVAAMSSYELDYLLDTLEFKLKVLDTPEAIEAREWLGRYLSVMADRKRAAVLADLPNVVDMSSGEMIEALRELEARRSAVEKRARDTLRSRREFAAFQERSRRADERLRASLRRIRRGDVSFSPYRGQPVGDPPFADAQDSPTVIGVGPWGTFIGTAIGAF